MNDKLSGEPTRGIPLEGGINFRDMGGYPTHGPGRVRWRKLFRCGHLAKLTRSDKALLKEMGIAQIHDFRREEEQQGNPTPSLGIEVFGHYQMSMGSLSRFWELIEAGSLTGPKAHDIIVSAYGECCDEVALPYRRFFYHLRQNSQGSLFHCTAGKDRTGLAAALLLSALDVPREVIVEDYLLTRTYLDTENTLRIVERFLYDSGVEYWERAWLEPYCGVHRDNIEAFFDGVESRYGSVASYLDQALGLDAEGVSQLKDLFLET